MVFRMRRYLGALGSLAILQVALGRCPAARAEVPPLADVLKAVRELEDSVTSLSVESTISGLTHVPGHRDMPPILMRSVETSTVDGMGRARIEVDGESLKVVDGKPIVRPSKRTIAFDGSVCRSLSGVEAKTSGLVVKAGGPTGWTIDPREMTTHRFGKPVSQAITEDKGRIVGRANHDGHDVLAVETEAVTRNKVNWKHRYLIDPALGFAVVRRSQFIQFPPSTSWLEFDLVDSHDHMEVAPGVWLPRRAVFRTTDPTEDDARNGRQPRLAWEWNVLNDKWLLNPEVQESLFTIDFPPGTTVEDKVNSRTFKVTGITDEVLDEQAGLARRWRLTRGRWGLLAVNGLIAALALAYVLARRLLKAKR